MAILIIIHYSTTPETIYDAESDSKNKQGPTDRTIGDHKILERGRDPAQSLDIMINARSLIEIHGSSRPSQIAAEKAILAKQYGIRVQIHFLYIN